MPSEIDVVAHNAPSMMILEAMAREVGDDFIEKFNLKGYTAEVKLTINGVEVDFVATAQELWDRLEAQFKEEVLEKAKELVGASRLSKLQRLTDRYEWEMENEIEQLFRKEDGLKKED